MTTASTRQALAAFTRKLVEDHDKWDGLHTFVTLYADGDGVRVGTWAAVDPAIPTEGWNGRSSPGAGWPCRTPANRTPGRRRRTAPGTPARR